METEIVERERTPRTCRECSHWSEIEGRVHLSSILGELLEKFKARLQDENFKPTVGEYLKLIELEKELDSDRPKEIRVTWVDPPKLSRK